MGTQDRRFYLFCILGLAFFLRVTHLGLHEMWIDESNSVIIAERSLPGVIEGLSHDANPPLYYILLHFWMKGAGTGAVGVRLLSVLFGVLLVFLLSRVGEKMFSPAVGLFAALVAALSPMQIFYGQTARMYTLLPLLGLLSFVFLRRALEENQRKDWLGYTVCAAATLYTHNYGFFLLPIPWVMLVWKWKKDRIKSLLLSHLGVFVLYLPWLPIFLDQLAVERSNWIAQFMKPIPTLMKIPLSLDIFCVGAGYPHYFEYLNFGSSAFSTWVARGLFLALLYLAWTSRGRSSDAEKETPRRRWVLTYLFVPLLVAFLISLKKSVYLVGRYDFIAFPAFCILSGLGFSKLRRLIHQRIVVLVLFLLAVTALWPYYQTPPREGAKMTAEYLRRNALPNDLVVFTGYRRSSVQYYLQQFDVKLHLLSFPLSTAKHLGIYDEESLLRNPGRLQQDARIIVAQAKGSLGERGRLWIVDYPVPEINNYLNRELRGFIKVGDLTDETKRIYCFKLSKA